MSGSSDIPPIIPPQGPEPEQDSGALFRGMGDAVAQPTEFELFTRDLFQGLVDADNQRAQGFGENMLWQGAAAAKAVGDGIVNIFSLGMKGTGAALGAIDPDATAGEGYEIVTQGIDEAFGSRDPGLFEALQAIDPFDDGSIQMGGAADAMIDARLGRQAVIGQTVGHLLSFATGPSAAIGKLTSKASGPLSRWGGKVFAQATAGKDVANALLKQGRVWDYVASTPKWKQALAKVGGDFVTDSIDTGAMMAAQAYGLAPDDERWESMKAMALMAPVMLPIARMGQWSAQKLSRMGMSPEQVANVRAGISKLESGQMGWQAMDDLVTANTKGLPRNIAKYIMAPSMESAAFMGLDGNSRKLFGEAIGGDSDAMAELVAIWAGTAGGIAATKYGLPIDGIPMLKKLRPDLNGLKLHAEAAASRKVRVTDKDLLAQEQGKEKPVSPERTAGVPGQEPMNLSPSRFMGELSDMTKLRRAHEKKQQEALEVLDVMWAEVPADAAMKSGWDASFPGSGVVELTHGKGFSMRLKRQGETGDINVSMSAETRKALNDFGLDVPEGTLGGPKAVEVLGQVPMLSTLRQTQGTLLYEQLGFSEVTPGVYSDPNTGLYHTMQLDGRTATRKPLESEWTGSLDLVSVGTTSEVVWSHPTLDQLGNFITQKQALAPDPLVDAILANVVRVAKQGRGESANELRSYLENKPFEEILAEMRPGTDASLALRLGRLATSHSNAEHALVSPEANRLIPEAKVAVEEGGKEPLTDKETLAQLLSDFVEPKVGGRESEAGFIGVNRTPEEVAEAKGLSQTKKRGRKMTLKASKDFMARAPAEILERELPGSELPRRGREIIADTGSISGEAGKGVRLARNAASSRTGRKFLSETVRAGQDKRGVLKMAKIKNAPKDFEYRVARLAIDKRVTAPEGLSAKEAKVWADVSEGAQSALKSVYEANQKAGTMQMKDGEMRPMRDIEDARLPYDMGKGVEPVMKQTEMRHAYFDGLAATHNRMVPERNPKTGRVVKRKNSEGKLETVMRRETGKDISDRYDAEVQKQIDSGVDAKNVDVKQALEFTREYGNRPDLFRGHEMLEPNVIRSLDSTVAKQAAGAATHRHIGQDVPHRQKVAKSLKAQLDKLPERDPSRVRIEQSLDMLENRPGVQEATKQYKKELLARMEKAGDTGEFDRIADLSERWVERIQGGEPEKLGPVLAAFSKYARYASPILAVKSGLYDVPDMAVRGWIYFGARETGKAIMKVAKKPREAIHYAEDIGAMIRPAGDLAIQEARGMQKAADFFARPSVALEQLKGAINTKLADSIIARFKKGTAPEGYYDVIRNEMALDAKTFDRVRSKDIDQALETQLRREIVNLLGSRVTNTEISEFGSSPKLSALIPFRKFFTARLPKIIDTMAAVHRSKTKEEFGRNAWRATKMITGVAVGGTMATWLSLSLSEFFKSGDPTRGSKLLLSRLTEGWDQALETQASEDFLSAMGSTAAELGKQGLSQVFGGPFSSGWQAVTDPSDARSLANLTHPSRLGWALAMGVASAAKGDYSRAFTFLASDTGAVPLSREAKNFATLLSAAVTGENTEILSDARFVRGWMRDEGIKTTFSERTKPDEFYEAVDDVVAIAARTDLTNAEKLAKSREALTVGLSLAPEDSLASSIEGRQLMRRLSIEQRDELLKASRDEKMMERLYHHDKMIKEVASAVREMDGTPQGDWDEMVKAVEKHAALGAGDKWRSLAERAISDTVDSVVNNEGYGMKLTDVSEAMASFPEQLEGVLSERDAIRVRVFDDSSMRAWRIEKILKGRVDSRAKAKRKERFSSDLEQQK